jgi:hypothetical protein
MARRVDENRRLYQQIADLRAKYPDSQAQWKQGVLFWTGSIQPNPLCATYRVGISWDGHRRRPLVRVLAPRLMMPDGKYLPHVFPGDELCLHYPSEWSAKMPIADTIVPWTSEWLFFYELWLATDEWHGGGHDPLSAEKDDPNQEDGQATQSYQGRDGR